MAKSTSKNKIAGAVIAVVAAAAGIFGATQLPAGGQIVGPIYVNADAQDGGDGTVDAPFNNLYDASVAQSAQRETIYILASEADLPPVVEAITLNAGGGSQRVVRGPGNTGTLITIGADGTSVGSVTVVGGVVDGMGIASTGPLFYLDGGDLILNNGNLQNNTTLSDGGAVYMSTGNFNMNGGGLLNNIAARGGGVFISVNGGKMFLNGGTISGNQTEVTEEMVKEYGDGYWTPRASGKTEEGAGLLDITWAIEAGVFTPGNTVIAEGLAGADASYSVWVEGDAAAAAREARIHYLNYEAQVLTADEFNELMELLREAA